MKKYKSIRANQYIRLTKYDKIYKTKYGALCQSDKRRGSFSIQNLFFFQTLKELITS